MWVFVWSFVAFAWCRDNGFLFGFLWLMMVLGVAFVWFAYMGWGQCSGAFGLARAMDRVGAHQLAHAR
jgi:hypothetical protein